MALKPPPLPSAARRAPSASELALQDAAAAIQAGRPAEAERLAAEVLKANAGNVAAMRLLGSALLMQGRGAEAIAPLQRAVRQSRDAGAETWLAMALRQAGREDEARERLERAVKRTPPFPPAFLELADMVAAGDADRAVALLRQGLAAAPGAADLALALGRLYEARGKLDAAHAAFAQAVAAAPGHRQALFAYARTLQARRDFAQAADSYRRILALLPQDADAEIGLGICLMELGRGEEALPHLRAASHLSPAKFGEVIGALADAGRGRFWLRPSDAARALRGKT